MSTETPQTVSLLLNQTELPPYRVRVSDRARKATIRILPVGDVEVVIPQHFNVRLVPELIGRHQDWLLKKLHQIRVARTHRPFVNETLPSRVVLSAIGASHGVKYQQRKNGRVREDGAGSLTVSGPDQQNWKRVLQKWLKQRAREHLVPRLIELAQGRGMCHGKVIVRTQKTRWGSCSSSKNISINANLLFLPSPLVRYVMAHELCHTIIMNHSASFWHLLGKTEPGYLELDTALKEAWSYVPLWAYPK